MTTRPWTVLVPRSGAAADRTAALIATHGGVAVVEPFVATAPPVDPAPFAAAADALGAGAFDWVFVTSAATADALRDAHAIVPPQTSVAAVGQVTAAALARVGIEAEFTTPGSPSSDALVTGWHAANGGAGPLRILVLQSNLAPANVGSRLAGLGHHAVGVVAYQTVEVDASPEVLAHIRDGALDAIVVTSGSVAASLARQLSTVPEGVIVASIGPRTTEDARLVGLRVDVESPRPDMEAMILAVKARLAERVGT